MKKKIIMLLFVLIIFTIIFTINTDSESMKTINQQIRLAQENSNEQTTQNIILPKEIEQITDECTIEKFKKGSNTRIATVLMDCPFIQNDKSVWMNKSDYIESQILTDGIRYNWTKGGQQKYFVFNILIEYNETFYDFQGFKGIVTAVDKQLTNKKHRSMHEFELLINKIPVVAQSHVKSVSFNITDTNANVTIDGSKFVFDGFVVADMTPANNPNFTLSLIGKRAMIGNVSGLNEIYIDPIVTVPAGLGSGGTVVKAYQSGGITNFTTLPVGTEYTAANYVSINTSDNNRVIVGSASDDFVMHRYNYTLNVSIGITWMNFTWEGQSDVVTPCITRHAIDVWNWTANAWSVVFNMPIITTDTTFTVNLSNPTSDVINSSDNRIHWKVHCSDSSASVLDADFAQLQYEYTTNTVPVINNAYFNTTSINQNDITALITEVQVGRDVDVGTIIDRVNASFLYPNGTMTNVSLTNINITNITSDLEINTISKVATHTGIIFEENFTAGYYEAPNWTDDAFNDWRVDTSRGFGDSTSASGGVVSGGAGCNPSRIRRSDQLYVGNASYSQINITTRMFADADNDLGDDIIFEMSGNNGSTWTEASRVKGGTAEENTWIETNYTLQRNGVNDSFLSDNLTFAYSCASNVGTGEQVHWDAMRVVGISLADQNTSYTAYNNVLSDSYHNIHRINVTVTVSYYNNSGSIAGGISNPNLSIELYNGTNWVDIGNSTITSATTFNISTNNNNLLTTWITSANRDVRIRGINFDGKDSINKDTINWTEVYVSIDGSSNTNWTYIWTDTASVGTYNVTFIWLSDTAGSSNQTNYTALYFNVSVVDSTAPTITFVAPTSANGTYTSNYAYINVTVSDTQNNIASCALEWNGINESMTRNATNQRDVHCFINKTSLSVGNYTYRVWASDSVNNGVSATRYYDYAPADTCTYISGDWVVTCSDNCVITSNVDLNGNALIINGATGTFEVRANVTRYNSIAVANGCKIAVQSGSRIGGNP